MKTTHRKAAHHKRQSRGIYGGVILLMRNSPYSEADLADKINPIRDSFAAIKAGAATPVDLENMDIAMTTTLGYARSIDALVVLTATVARDAIGRCWERYQHTGRWGWDGPALQAMEDGIDLHEQMLRQSTPADMMAAARLETSVVPWKAIAAALAHQGGD